MKVFYQRSNFLSQDYHRSDKDKYGFWNYEGIPEDLSNYCVVIIRQIEMGQME